MTRIPNQDAELLLHRYVTERVPILVFFQSAGKSMEVKLKGFVASSTAARGLYVAAEWPSKEPGVPMPSFMRLNISGSSCEYSDETEEPPEVSCNGFGSTLQLNMPNGDTLYITEVKTQK